MSRAVSLIIRRRIFSTCLSTVSRSCLFTPSLLNPVCTSHIRTYSANFSDKFTKADERSIEEEAERKIGWLLKLIFFGTAGVVGYNLFPYMGENLMQQSVSLLHVKDPLFKRMGASRLARFAIDDKRRMKIVELGGAKELVSMLAAAKDDRTREAALKALVAISKSDDAVGALNEAGAMAVIIMSTSDSTENNEIDKHKSTLLSRFRDLRYDISSSRHVSDIESSA